MSFFGSLRGAFKGGAGKRVPLARSFISPWSFAVEAAPFEYRGAVRRAFLENPVAQRAVRLVAEGVGGAPLAGEPQALALVSATSAGQGLLETLASQLLLHGNAFVQVTRDASGAPVEPVQSANLVPIGGSGARRCVLGAATSALPASSAMLFDRASELEIVLVSSDFGLTEASLAALAAGANRALLGDEVVQFAAAVETAPATWRLRGLLRGRGGTEAAARRGHMAGTPFVLLDDGPVLVDPEAEATHLAAIGLADAGPVIAEIANPGLTMRPLTPVHPRMRAMPGGGIALQWTRRARGAWSWSDGVDAPLNEQREAYLVGLGDTGTPALRWEVDQPRLELSAATLAGLSQAHGGKALWVRQIGAQAVSAPLLLTTLA